MKTSLIMGLLLAFLVGCVDGGTPTFTQSNGDPLAYIQTPNGDTLLATGLIKKSTIVEINMNIDNSSYMRTRGR